VYSDAHIALFLTSARSMSISGERESTSFQAPHLREEHPKGKARKWFGRVRCQWKVPIQFKFPSLTISSLKVQSPGTLYGGSTRFLFFVRINLTSHCTLLKEDKVTLANKQLTIENLIDMW